MPVIIAVFFFLSPHHSLISVYQNSVISGSHVNKMSDSTQWVHFMEKQIPHTIINAHDIRVYSNPNTQFFSYWSEHLSGYTGKRFYRYQRHDDKIDREKSRNNAGPGPVFLPVLPLQLWSLEQWKPQNMSATVQKRTNHTKVAKAFHFTAYATFANNLLSTKNDKDMTFI